jgi:hypothetical protein
MANETELSKQYSQDKRENLPLSFEPDILLAAQYFDRFQRKARLDPAKETHASGFGGRRILFPEVYFVA